MKKTQPGIYEGYSTEQYDGWERFSEYLPMRDGVKIAIDYYIPTKNGNLAQEALPVVWIFSPYDYRTVMAENRWMDGTSYEEGFEEEITGFGKLMLRHGYIFAMAEVRGTGASFGWRHSVNNYIEAMDAYEVCEWLGTQKWSNGKTGSFGYSYFGGTQLEALRYTPPHLTAAFIGMTDYDKYDAWVRGGILRKFGTQPDAPSVLDLGNTPVGGMDDPKAKEVLEKAARNHDFSTMQAQNMRDCPYRDSWCEETDSYLWQTISNSTYKEHINRGDTLVYLYGGWRDVFRRDTFLLYRNMVNAKKVLVGPWHHMDARPGFDFDIERLRFFDYSLKGIENGIMDEPELFYHTYNHEDGWVFADSWPPENAEMKSVFLSEGESNLAFTAPEDLEKYDEYQVRYDISENIDNDLVTIEREEKGLVYTSAQLEEDINMTGHPILELWVSSTAEDGDFFVLLADVDEDGKGRYVTDAMIRASLRTLAEPHYDYIGLPWHRGFEKDCRKLKPGRKYRLRTDFLPTSYVFKKGHRIRLIITCAIGKILFMEEPVAPTISVYRDSIHTSYVQLPVVND